VTRRRISTVKVAECARPSTRRGVATRARIVRAARKLIVRDGPSGLTLRAVAGEAGIALSNLQFHFADQDYLLRAVLDAELVAGAAFVARALATHADAGVRDRDAIDVAIDAMLALQHQRGAARLYFSLWAVATTSRPLRAALHAFYAGWIARLTPGAPSEAQPRVWLLVALLEGASLFRCGVAGSTNAAQEKMLRGLAGRRGGGFSFCTA
jgi:AcrR family transcriptional regulator